MSKKHFQHVIFYNKNFDFDTSDVGSVNDCTGLIPFAPNSSYELECYNQLINYSPADINIYNQHKEQEKTL